MAEEKEKDPQEERSSDAKSASVVAKWLRRIKIASDEEEAWRKEASEVNKMYCAKKEKYSANDATTAFNILASNVNTLRPSLYNAVPIPDIRRRWQETDPDSQEAARLLERANILLMEDGTFHANMTDVINAYALVGRGVGRLVYDPTIEGEDVTWQTINFRCVPWDRFRRGPGQYWEQVTWVAFQHHLTRDELKKLNKDIGAKIDLDSAADGDEKDDKTKLPKDSRERSEVWEVWDKDERMVHFIAPAWKEEPVLSVEDPLGLEEFFPTPRPLYANRDPLSLVPLTDWRLYREQARELEEVSKRINATLRIIKWRGVYNQVMAVMAKLEAAQDGELVPAEGLPPEVDIARNIWLWPVEQAAQILQQLYMAREQIKQAIYEITGISDIMRGASDPSETLGAQNLKVKFGSPKMQERQGEVQRYCRDVIALQTEILAEHFDPMILSMMTGIQVTPQIQQLISIDSLRTWRIGIETDSTIRNDTSRAQEEIGNFVGGMGQFLGAVGPAIEAGVMTKEVAAEMMASFAKVYKLGRSAEQAIDQAVEGVKEEAKEPKPDPEAMKAQAEQKQHEDRIALEQKQHDDKIALEREGMALEREKAEAELEQKGQEIFMKHGMEGPMQMMAQNAQTIAAAAAALQGAVEALTKVSQVLALTLQQSTRPKAVEIVRGPDGRAVGARQVQAPMQ